MKGTYRHSRPKPFDAQLVFDSTDKLVIIAKIDAAKQEQLKA